MTWAATIVTASHCVGFTFPGIMLLPGSFSGRDSSPNPQRGPDPRYRISLAIFISEHATTFRAPWASNNASWVARASNYIAQKSVHAHACLMGCAHLIGRCLELQARQCRNFGSNLDIKTLLRIQTLRNNIMNESFRVTNWTLTVPTAVPPWAR
jgi:hypothetical protein